MKVRTSSEAILLHPRRYGRFVKCRERGKTAVRKVPARFSLAEVQGKAWIEVL
jgi:rRNA maturation protein Nop10